jgi:hypothetical protein
VRESIQAVWIVIGSLVVWGLALALARWIAEWFDDNLLVYFVVAMILTGVLLTALIWTGLVVVV